MSRQSIMRVPSAGAEIDLHMHNAHAQAQAQAPDTGAQHTPVQAETRCTLTARPGPQRHLVIDALNYLTFFFPVFEPSFRGRPPWSLYSEMLRRVVFFLQSCALAHWVPHFVIDSGQQSDEVRAKWRMRREREVASGFRAMPYNAGACLRCAVGMRVRVRVCVCVCARR
jgi:hypothetical protein